MSKKGNVVVAVIVVVVVVAILRYLGLCREARETLRVGGHLSLEHQMEKAARMHNS